jgi:hypothetical protein
MSQNIINELTDRVSALTADVSHLRRERDVAVNALSVAIMERDATDESARDILRTADGILGENKRLKAEVEALSEELEHMIWTHDDKAGNVEAHERVKEIKIEARNNIS